MNIADLLKQVQYRDEYPFTFFCDDFISFPKLAECYKDSYLEKLLKQSEERIVYYIGFPLSVTDYFSTHSNSEWKIKGIAQLGHPLKYIPCDIENPDEEDLAVFVDSHRDENWYLFVFTKDKVESVSLSFNNFYESARSAILDDFFDWKNDIDIKYKGKPIILDEEFFKTQILLPNGVLNDDNYIQLIPRILEIYNFSNLTPFYSEIEKFLESGKIPKTLDSSAIMFTNVKYSDFHRKYLINMSRYKPSVVDIFNMPKESEKLKTLRDLGSFVVKNKKSFSAQPYDIVFTKNTAEDGSLIKFNARVIEKTEQIEEAVFVFRPNCKTKSYFIALVLQSDFIKDFNYQWGPYDFNYSDYPIFICEDSDNNYYKDRYNLINSKSSYIQKQLDSFEDVAIYNKNAFELIRNDYNEILQCYKIGAYKAATFLAGSVLEALLIDWHSYLDKKNYFNEKYKSKTKKHKNMPNLEDYIKDLKAKKPDWNFEGKCHTIQHKRNLIHAKLYIANDEINARTCWETIDLLDQVIKSRWPKYF